MTNPRNRKSGEHVGKCERIDEDTLSGSDEQVDESISSESVSQSNGKYDDDDDADETLQDCDTTTTFSLQECMNEFRARRIRRNSAHNRPKGDSDKFPGNNCIENTEIDFIGQNLKNKEHERKYKPCKNGFCYCFTSDSGESGMQRKCQVTPHHRRNVRRTDNPLIKGSGHPVMGTDCQSSPLKSTHIKQMESKTIINRSITKTITYPVKAISSLETTKNNAPLIHITQELRDNCVISKVRINKQKMERYRNNSNATERLNNSNKVKKAHFTKKESPKFLSKEGILNNPYTPTAPTLEKISEFDTPESTAKDNSISKNIKHRHKHGGKLLQKRLSNASINCKQRSCNEAPPKPPRSYASGLDKVSSSTLTSTSPSIREAERILDEFLAEKGYTFNKPDMKQLASEENAQKRDKIKKFSTGHQRVDQKCKARTYPSLSDVERTIESKAFTKFVASNTDDGEKDVCIGWAEPKICEMLNYESEQKVKKFRSLGVQAESQKSNHNNKRNMIQPKVELDTVDGVVKRNLETNVTQKDTPVKIHLFNTPTNKGDSKANQKSVWRNLSPWSNKRIIAKHPRDNKNNPNDSTKSVSTAFLKTSKKKILRLVSPKKLNKDQVNAPMRKTCLSRTVGVQTSSSNIHADSNGHLPVTTTDSYHSPIESSKVSFHKNTNKTTDFNFNRLVHSPNRRKPNVTRNNNVHYDAHNFEEKTYLSYANDLDQEVTVSKMGYILSNIRAKLEASDDHAVRTFQDMGEKGKYLDGQRRQNSQILCGSTHLRRHALINEPIYSEIEEHSLHILETPHYDNHTGVENNGDKNSEPIYAKVNKVKGQTTAAAQPPTALGKILHESLKEGKVSSVRGKVQQLNRCSSLEMIEQQSSDISIKNIQGLPHSVSLNNVRVTEQSPSCQSQDNTYNSNLSLHQSGIFLDNLCKSELIVSGISVENSDEIMNNNKFSKSFISVAQPSPDDNQNVTTLEVTDSIQTDSISYEFPNEDIIDDIPDANTDSSIAGNNNVTIKNITPPLSHNQSTPKKKRTSSYITKEEVDQSIGSSNNLYEKNHSFFTKNYREHEFIEHHQQQQTQSLNNLGTTDKPLCCTSQSNNTFLRCHQLKNMLCKSFRKSRKFVRTEARRLSMSLSLSSANVTGMDQSTLQEQHPHQHQLQQQQLERSRQIQTDRSIYSMESSLYLEALFALDETAPVTEQLCKAVNICRNLPELQVSPEMVEAERLLLYSTLKFERQLVAFKPPPMRNQAIIRFFIDDIYLHVQTNDDYDLFFNYFYIITFECDGIIKSTQSIECENGVVTFEECGIEYTYYSTAGQEPNAANEQYAVRGNIFVLRLRKVSTLALEPSNMNNDDCDPLSSCEIVSRFRLNDTFLLTAQHFAPYEYVASESKTIERLCIRAAPCSIDLKENIKLKGRAELRLPKINYSGFLNVEDPHLQHNWNRRWCILDGIDLHVWHDINCINQKPLFDFNLLEIVKSGQLTLPLVVASPELCSRPRSFSVPYIYNNDDTNVQRLNRTAVFFSADCQNDLVMWLNQLNMTFDWITKWLY